MPQFDPDYTNDFTTNFRPLLTIETYNPQYFDPDYGCDPYWDEKLYDQHHLQFRHVLKKSAITNYWNQKIPPTPITRKREP